MAPAAGAAAAAAGAVAAPLWAVFETAGRIGCTSGAIRQMVQRVEVNLMMQDGSVILLLLFGTWQRLSACALVYVFLEDKIKRQKYAATAVETGKV